MTRINRGYFVWLAALLMVGWLVSGASATDFTGTSSGIFNDPLPVGATTTGVGTNFFTWGDANGFGTGPSSLTFTGIDPLSGNFETEFSFGTLTFFNGTITVGTEATSVTMVATLDFTTPTGIVDFHFPLTLTTTPNTSDPVASADSVILSSPVDPTAFFTVGGINYFLQFTRFGDVIGNGFLTPDGLTFNVEEGQSASADMFGILTANPVPLPPSMLLLGSGLLGLVGLRRFRKS